MIKLKDILLSEKFASKAQQGYLYAKKPNVAKKLASKMNPQDYKELPDKVDEESLDEKGTRCWKGYKKKGMKTMFGKRVPNCVKNEAELEKEKFTTPNQMRMYEDEVDEGSLPIKLKDILNVKKMKLSKDAPEAVKDFWGHHHEHPGTADGPAEPDTYDFDDDMQSDPGLQFDDSDDEEEGYEPVEENLKRWFKEKWTDQHGRPCGNKKTKGIKKCRPSKKVSGKTPKTWRQVDKKKEVAKKRRVGMGKRTTKAEEIVLDETNIEEKKDACYHKVKARYNVWPSAYASGALVKCRKKGAANWGTGGKKK